MSNSVPQPYFNNFTRNIVSSFWLPTWEETKCLAPSESKGVKERKQNWFNTDIFRSKLADTWLQQFYPSLGNFLQRTEREKELKKKKEKEEKKKKGYEDTKEKKRLRELKHIKNEKLKIEGKYVDNSLDEDENFDLYEVEQKEEQKVFLEKMKDIKSRKRKKSVQSRKDEKKESKEPKERKKTIKKEKANNTLKVRVYLSVEQEISYKQKVGTCRWIYNMCINLENYGVLSFNDTAKNTKTQLRYCFSSPETIQEMIKSLQTHGYKKPQIYLKQEEEKRPYLWVFHTPAKIRDEAISDFLKNRKSAKESIKEIKSKGKQKTSTPKLKYRTLKQRQQSLPIPCQDWNEKKKTEKKIQDKRKRKGNKKKKVKDYSTCLQIPKGSLKDLCGPYVVLPAKSKEILQIPEKLPYDSRLIRTRDRKYYLCIPRFVPQHDNQVLLHAVNPYELISLDPGVRAPFTGYDPSGIVYKWGHNDINRICKLAIHYDKIQSKCSQTAPTVKHHYRYKFRKAARRIQEKIRNLVGELHKKLALFLCKNYKIILLPEFNVSQMLKRFHRRISRKTVRQMVTWAHYRFRQRLLYKQQFFPGCKVIICDEAYTSKTCGKCGFIHAKLGGAKEFKCPNPLCNYHGDRDIHAARNILLRYLTNWKIKNSTDEALLTEKLMQLPRIASYLN